MKFVRDILSKLSYSDQELVASTIESLDYIQKQLQQRDQTTEPPASEAKAESQTTPQSKGIGETAGTKESRAKERNSSSKASRKGISKRAKSRAQGFSYCVNCERVI